MLNFRRGFLVLGKELKDSCEVQTYGISHVCSGEATNGKQQLSERSPIVMNLTEYLHMHREEVGLFESLHGKPETSNEHEILVLIGLGISFKHLLCNEASFARGMKAIHKDWTSQECF